MVQRVSRGRMVCGYNPGGGDIFHTPPDRPWTRSDSFTRVIESFLRVKGVALNTNPHLTPRLKKEYSSFVSSWHVLR